jgi:hypothetical protein
MNLSGVTAAAAGTWSMIARLSSQVARQAAPSMNTCIAAAGLLVSMLAMWWWAERTLSV